MGTKYGLNPDTVRGRVVNYVLAYVMAALILAPVIILVVTSLKTQEEYFRTGVFAMPENPILSNYGETLTRGNLGTGFRNTGILVAFTVTTSLMLGSMASYVIARFRFPLRKTVMFGFVFAMIVPGMVTEVARFTVIQSLGLFNTLGAGMLLMSSANVIQIYVFLQFINKIPPSLDESALMDGASYFRIFFRIILPLMTPALATITVLKAIAVYNNVLVPFLYMPKNSLAVVSTALMRFAKDEVANWPLMSAGILVVMIPTLILYILLQRYIISGLTGGSVKY